jgi:hypothetical protein
MHSKAATFLRIFRDSLVDFVIVTPLRNVFDSAQVFAQGVLGAREMGAATNTSQAGETITSTPRLARE